MTMKITQANLCSELAELGKSQPLFVIMIGAPGSGKSTFLSSLKNHMPFVIASTDDQIEAHAAINGLTYSQAFEQISFKTLKQRMKLMLFEAVSQSKHVFIDQTNMSRKSRSEKLKLAVFRHVKIAVDFEVPSEVVLERLKARELATGKVIPKSVFYSMMKAYEAPTCDEGFNRVYTVC